MKKISVLTIILLQAALSHAKEQSWAYSHWIMSSSVRTMNCEKIDGGYTEYSKKFKTQMKSMQMESCSETNSMGLNTNIIVCPSSGEIGNSISGFWFKDKTSCEASVNSKRSKE